MNITQTFLDCDALLEGHFVLSSGLHSDKYLQCAKVLQYPKIAAQLGELLAAQFNRDEIDVVVGPAMGGIIIAQEVGRALDTRTIFTERESGKMTLRRGFEIEKGEKVLIVEDVITTGGSACEVAEMLRDRGAEIIGFGAIIDRSGGSTEFPAPFKALEKVEVATYQPDACPMCAEGTPAVKPGSRSKV
jgi:orotate phosphoribosyltransferase